jgi:hypothetical protein
MVRKSACSGMLFASLLLAVVAQEFVRLSVMLILCDSKCTRKTRRHILAWNCVDQARIDLVLSWCELRRWIRNKEWTIYNGQL